MYVGGLRDRLIHDNLYSMIYDALYELGWLTANSNHKAVRVRAEPIPVNEEITPNVVAISDEHTLIDEMELGSHLSEYRWEYWVDIYAESLPIGKHLAGDVRTILEGKFNSIGRYTPNVVVYDLTQATPSEIFTCEIENVEVERSRFYEKPFQKYWYMIRFELVDCYIDEDSE